MLTYADVRGVVGEGIDSSSILLLVHAVMLAKETWFMAERDLERQRHRDLLT
jgi:hypothetical protein